MNWISKHIWYPLWEIKDGAHRLKFLRELSNSQWESTEKLRQRQWQRLCAMTKYAFQSCHYYHGRFSEAGLSGTLHGWGDFLRLPVLTKRDIRENTDSLISREFRKQDLIVAKTGGSTGTALTLYFDRRCQEMRNAAAMRSDRWAGWDLGLKIAAVWGNPPKMDSLKAKLRNRFHDRMFFLDTMNINEGSILRFVDEWRREKPDVLFGHSHSIYVLAKYLRKLHVHDLRPRGIISTSMMLLEPERRAIEEVFLCPVTNRYGCEEVGLIGCECEQHHGLHLNIDHLVVEFLRDDGTEASPGEEGAIVVTDLSNCGMPLIRYRVEDIGVPSGRQCSCGRGLPLMERVTGRDADFLKRPDGSLVAGVSLVERTLTAISGIEQMQLVQEELYSLRARVVRDKGYDSAAERQLRQELTAAMGQDVAIVIEYVPHLEQSHAGKYRFAVCNMN